MRMYGLCGILYQYIFFNVFFRFSSSIQCYEWELLDAVLFLQHQVRALGSDTIANLSKDTYEHA